MEIKIDEETKKEVENTIDRLKHKLALELRFAVSPPEKVDVLQAQIAFLNRSLAAGTLKIQ